jgi:transketolase
MHNNQPTIIEVNTIIGYGSRFQGTNSVHGSPLSADQIQELRTNLRYKVPPFMIHENVKEQMALVYKRGNVHQRKFNLALQQLESKDLNLYNEYIKLSNNQFAFNNAWFDTYQSKPDTSTRLMFSDLLQYVLIQNDTFMVGSADLTSSTFITHKKSIPFTVKTRRGQNIFFGVREFAMAAINNGITAHGGCRCITSTFLVFSDYNKAALRLAAISNLPAINVYSHDSITVGEDGPTHEPIEQIPSLRLIPNHFLFRPANKTECIVALEHAVKSTNSPTTIITSRGNIAQYDSPYELAMKGGYVFKHVDNHHINIIATGSEIPLAMKISESLQAEGINARVLSFNSIELFEAQSLDYKATIIDGKPTVSIEFAVTTP